MMMFAMLKLNKFPKWRKESELETRAGAIASITRQATEIVAWVNWLIDMMIDFAPKQVVNHREDM